MLLSMQCRHKQVLFNTLGTPQNLKGYTCPWFSKTTVQQTPQPTPSRQLQIDYKLLCERDKYRLKGYTSKHCSVGQPTTPNTATEEIMTKIPIDETLNALLLGNNCEHKSCVVSSVLPSEDAVKCINSIDRQAVVIGMSPMGSFPVLTTNTKTLSQSTWDLEQDTKRQGLDCQSISHFTGIHTDFNVYDPVVHGETRINSPLFNMVAQENVHNHNENAIQSPFVLKASKEVSQRDVPLRNNKTASSLDLSFESVVNDAIASQNTPREFSQEGSASRHNIQATSTPYSSQGCPTNYRQSSLMRKQASIQTDKGFIEDKRSNGCLQTTSASHIKTSLQHSRYIHSGSLGFSQAHKYMLCSKRRKTRKALAQLLLGNRRHHWKRHRSPSELDHCAPTVPGSVKPRKHVALVSPDYRLRLNVSNDSDASSLYVWPRTVCSYTKRISQKHSSPLRRAFTSTNEENPIANEFSYSRRNGKGDVKRSYRCNKCGWTPVDSRSTSKRRQSYTNFERITALLSSHLHEYTIKMRVLKKKIEALEQMQQRTIGMMMMTMMKTNPRHSHPNSPFKSFFNFFRQVEKFLPFWPKCYAIQWMDYLLSLEAEVLHCDPKTTAKTSGLKDTLAREKVRKGDNGHRKQDTPALDSAMNMSPLYDDENSIVDYKSVVSSPHIHRNTVYPPVRISVDATKSGNEAVPKSWPFNVPNRHIAYASLTSASTYEYSPSRTGRQTKKGNPVQSKTCSQSDDESLEWSMECPQSSSQSVGSRVPCSDIEVHLPRQARTPHMVIPRFNLQNVPKGPWFTKNAICY